MPIRLTVIVCLSFMASAFVPLAPAHAQTAKAAPQAAKAGPPPIPRATFIADMEGEFRTIDSDRNEILTAAEIEAWQRAATARRNAEQANTLFAQLDTNRNGQIDPAEFARIPLPSRKPDAAPMISRFDKNKDKAISLVEYRGGTLVNFDRLDTDNDGIVSPAEMRAVGIGR